MKTNKIYSIQILSVLVFLTCFHFTIVLSQDDLYYSPSKEKSEVKPYVMNPSQSENSEMTDYERYRALKSDTNELNKTEEQQPAINSNNEQQSDNSNQPINEKRVTENYSQSNSYNDYDNNDYYYSSRLRRFHSPYFGSSYYDPFYTDYYYYNYDPFWCGSSIYWGSPYWSYGFSLYYPSYYSYYSPYYYGAYYPYHHAYWNGYYNGYYSNYYSNYNSRGSYQPSGGRRSYEGFRQSSINPTSNRTASLNNNYSRANRANQDNLNTRSSRPVYTDRNSSSSSELKGQQLSNNNARFRNPQVTTRSSYGEQNRSTQNSRRRIQYGTINSGSPSIDANTRSNRNENYSAPVNNEGSYNRPTRRTENYTPNKSQPENSTPSRSTYTESPRRSENSSGGYSGGGRRRY